MQLQDPNERLKKQCRRYTVGDVLQTYLDDFIDVGNFGRTKLAAIKALINRPDLAGMDAMNLRRSDILDYLRRRLKEAKPQTVKNGIMWLSVAFKTVAASREWPIAAAVVSIQIVLQNRLCGYWRGGQP
ncbi:hypothetical protein FDY93_00720 [Microbulbifer harenosus]|uniref:Core-binding (CB) domain-containing protein n=2 Tax=Microbulbifer harenosus TaxID=2576840 RepID=A0ABY2UNQ0_9GAMM|nr:hypothetical protein FDY93_00720 [Microbulbifer harenosus]